MNNKILFFLMNGIIGRWFFIFLNAITVFFSFYCVKYIVYSIMDHLENSHKETPSFLRSMLHQIMHNTPHIEANGLDKVNITINSVGGVLISLGVLMESRETIVKMTKTKITPLQEHLNAVSEYCGMGLLLIGLFIEIFTVIIEVPNDLINTVGIENYLYSACVFFITLAAIIEIAFMKEFIKTYFNKSLNNNID